MGKKKNKVTVETLMNGHVVTTKTIISRIKGFGKKPKTILDTLLQTRAFLKDEKRWVSGEWFQDGEAADAYEKDGICGDWGCCVMGTVGLVTGEAKIQVVKESWENYFGPQESVYWKGTNWTELVADGNTLTGKVAGFLTDSAEEVTDGNHSDPVGVNDSVGYSAVMLMLDDGIKRATEQGV